MEVNYSRHNIRSHCVCFVYSLILCQTEAAAPVVDLVEHAPIEMRLAADGAAYTWAEFENYFDADMAAEIW